MAQLTRVGSGLSGITNTSPALSVSSSTGTAAFSVYNAGNYEIYAIDAVSARAMPLGPASKAAAMLPPADRAKSDVADALANATFGLPAAAADDVANYKPALTLEGVAQPSISVGASRFGTAIGGGIGFQFGDMLGDRVLTTVLQIDSGLSDNFSFKTCLSAALVLDMSRRWNWASPAGRFRISAEDSRAESASRHRVSRFRWIRPSSSGRRSGTRRPWRSIHSAARSAWSSKGASASCRSIRSCRRARTH